MPIPNETTTEIVDDEIINVVDTTTGVSVPDDDHPPPKHGTRGRPPLVIDIKKLHAIAATFCTYEEMAVIFDCCEDTLRRRYSREIEKGRAMGRMSYRQEMRLRMKSSDRVLIHMYEKHVSPPPPRAGADAIIQVIGDNVRPLIIREVDEDSDTAR